MFNTIDAAFYYPPDEHAYFFKGPEYIKYRPDHGVVLLSGRELRTIGVDGWQTFPAEFRTGIDAALYYPPNGHAYFFKGAKYIEYKVNDGVVPLQDGRIVRNLGQDGWTSFPSAFAQGVDAALFHSGDGHAYFFKADKYIKVHPDHGVVPIGAAASGTIGIDDWMSFPAEFRQGIDAAMEYPPDAKIYFFRSRDYLAWTPVHGVEPRHPRRIGLLHGEHSGWRGLSHVIAGPLVGPVTEDSAAVWLWVTDAKTAGALAVEVDGIAAQVLSREPASPELVGALDAIDSMSCVRVLRVQGLSPGTRYVARILLGNTELDRVAFTTRPPAATEGRVKLAFGSCANMSKHTDVPAFKAMSDAQPDFALFAGDNCYYVNAALTTGRTGLKPRDWESAQRMLVRQVDARNHPDFTSLSRTVPCYATWDDHDFAYNDAVGTDRRDDWVGPKIAAAVFRAMWPNPYARGGPDQAIYGSFRWGPVEVFMTDNRFHKDRSARVIWGQQQLDWLITGLIESAAAVKIVVTSTQFLFNRDYQEGHTREAPAERSALLDRIIGPSGAPPAVRGRVLLLSGDVHFSELLRPAPGDPAPVLEFTSSPLRQVWRGEVPAEKTAGTRIWAAQQDAFGVVAIDVQSVSPEGAVTGTITLEARDDRGKLIEQAGRQCRSVWDLGTGHVA